MVARWLYEETVELPGAVRFPVELEPPEGFDPERPETWPKISGRLEFVDGRLLYMPPCGDRQQYTVTDVVIVLGSWVRAHRELVLGTNEAGLRLEGSTRAADAAVWRRADAGPVTGGLQRHPPLLAVEVAGRFESERALTEKARWYLGVGVKVVWLILPESREVVVLTPAETWRGGSGARLPAHPELPDLAPAVDDFFIQLSGG
jgi:Uma2 family endonuclease